MVDIAKMGIKIAPRIICVLLNLFMLSFILPTEDASAGPLIQRAIEAWADARRTR